MGTEPKEFKDVTLYMPGFSSNIERIDAIWARVWVGPYAQYKEYVQCECLEKGKRKPRSLDCNGYLVVVQTMSAILPDDRLLPFVSSSDGTYSSAATRYGIGDPRWRTDFDEQLLTANVTILADYRKLPSDAETGSLSMQRSENAGGQVPASPTEPVTIYEDEVANSDFEEGIRYQAERSFFQRNIQLAQQARAVYGCVCKACGFDFAKTYGSLGQGFAEVHHLNPLSERPPDEWTAAVQTSVDEVAVLCANCHRMIHRRKPAFSVEELRAMISTRLGPPPDPGRA
jgi:hypothetical protein